MPDAPDSAGEVIRRARLTRRWSQATLADRMVQVRAARGEKTDPTSTKTQLSRWENGHVLPDRPSLELIAAACTTSVEVLFGIGTPQALPQPVLRSAHVTADTIRQLDARRLVHAQTEHSFGPGTAAALVHADLTTIDRLLQVTPPDLAADMYAVAALTAELDGWVGQEVGDLQHAVNLTATAHRYARAAQNPAIEAMVLMRWSHVVTPTNCRLGATLADEAAELVSNLNPSRLHATIAHRRAHVAAVAGDRTTFARCAAQAADYSHADASPDLPHGAADLTPYAGPSWIASETAASLLVLEDPASAADILAEHIDTGAEPGQERDYAVAICRWLQAAAAAGDTRTALDRCEEAITAYQRAPSMRAKTALYAIVSQTRPNEPRSTSLSGHIAAALDLDRP